MEKKHQVTEGKHPPMWSSKTLRSPGVLCEFYCLELCLIHVYVFTPRIMKIKTVVGNCYGGGQQAENKSQHVKGDNRS